MKYIYLILYFVFVLSSVNCLNCKDEDGKMVDWFVIYKLPKHNKDIGSLINKGVAYAYITSNTIGAGWTLSNVSINSSKSIPGLTLQPYYNEKTSLHILYNDQPPLGAANDNFGHTKGVIMANDTHGFWLVHSVPHYPAKNVYNYPPTGLRYGQSFLCISTHIKVINDIGTQLLYNHPFIYKSYITSGLKPAIPNIYNALRNKSITQAPWYHVAPLLSTGNVHFLSFAKTKQFAKDLYHDWVSVELKSDLYVESWLNGPGKLPSNCTFKYNVLNVKSIKLPVGNVGFHSSSDHSKWAIVDSSRKLVSTFWVCIGDVNREEHQKSRGGGTVCTDNEQLWTHYHQIVTDVELCQNINSIHVL